MKQIEGLIPINIGLFGHIDHGKTAIARVLSEIISTAGLDKHRQAQERGISIDIGITSFVLENKYLITLVDAPGHADLIRSVVAASNIIDGAILVISADEGPKIQTGEHLLILDSFKVHNIIIALNKIDLTTSEEIKVRINEIKNILKGSSFTNVPIIPVSAKSHIGFDILKNELFKMIKTPKRNVDGSFKMPVDHAFQVKGAGTVLTGTIHRGSVEVGDIIEIMPLKIQKRIKSIQVFRTDQQKAVAGQRIGLSIIKLNPNDIFRGYYVCKPDTLIIANKLILKGKVNDLFNIGLQPRLQVHLTIGMPTVSGLIYPFHVINGNYILTDHVNKSEEFLAYVELTETISAEIGMSFLISRLDIEPTKLRIVASGTVESIIDKPPEFFRIKIKEGLVRNIDRKEGYVIEGFSNNVIGARKYIGKEVETENKIKGKIINTFGSKGNVLAQFDEKPKLNEKIFIKILRSFKI